MKTHFSVFLAILFFSMMLSSCGKKADDNTTMDMAKKDSMGGGGLPSPSVTISTAIMSGTNGAPGLSLIGNSTCKSATITVTDTSGNSYRWRAYYGASNDSTLVPGTPSGGTQGVLERTWSPGAFNTPQYWFPQYCTVAGPVVPSASWANFSSIIITHSSGLNDTAYAVVNGNTNANITIAVVAGGGEPGK